MNDINAVIINAPSIVVVVVVVVVATTNLIRGGASNKNGDGGQEDLSSTSVGDNYIKRKKDAFVEKEGGLLGDCNNNGPCTTHSGDAKACTGQGGYYWYPHHLYLYSPSEVGLCSNCLGVTCDRSKFKLHLL